MRYRFMNFSGDNLLAVQIRCFPESRDIISQFSSITTVARDGLVIQKFAKYFTLS